MSQTIHLYIWVYIRPIWQVVAALAAVILLWIYLDRKQPRYWRTGNVLLFLLTLAGILFITVLSRESGETEWHLLPFHALKQARIQPELYREMLMNVFLFIPFGLTLFHAQSAERRRGMRVLVTAAAALLLSIGIEWVQYCGTLGVAETDDVLCNLIGALIGAGSFLIADCMCEHRSKQL